MGDQLRARGQKSEDGLKVTADEVVFGTFVTKAGPLRPSTSKERNHGQGTGDESAAGDQLTADSQLKKMPDLPQWEAA